MAVTVHSPTNDPVTVDPLTPQMVGVSLRKVTGKPELDVAERVADTPIEIADIGLKLMV